MLLLTYEDPNAKIVELQKKLREAERQTAVYRTMMERARQGESRWQRQVSELNANHRRQAQKARTNAQLQAEIIRRLKHAVEAVKLQEVTTPMSVAEAHTRLKRWLETWCPDEITDVERWLRRMSLAQPMDNVPAWLRGMLRAMDHDGRRAPSGKYDSPRLAWAAVITKQAAKQQPQHAYLCDTAGLVIAEITCSDDSVQRAQAIVDATGDEAFLVLLIRPRAKARTAASQRPARAKKEAEGTPAGPPAAEVLELPSGTATEPPSTMAGLAQPPEPKSVHCAPGGAEQPLPADDDLNTLNMILSNLPKPSKDQLREVEARHRPKGIAGQPGPARYNRFHFLQIIGDQLSAELQAFFQQQDSAFWKTATGATVRQILEKADHLKANARA